jgi:hypothetical protein
VAVVWGAWSDSDGTDVYAAVSRDAGRAAVRGVAWEAAALRAQLTEFPQRV